MHTLQPGSRGAEPPPRPALQGADTYGRALCAAGGRLVEQRLRADDPSSVGVALYASPPYELQVPALPVSRLSIALTPSQLSGGLAGERPQAYQAPRYALFLAPAGATARWRQASPSRHLTLYFHARTLGDDGDALGDGPLLNAAVPGTRALVDELLAELQAGTPWSAEAADSLGRLLLIKVARQRARRRDGANPLTPALRARLSAYVQANLAERILVADLAAVAGLSPNRFAQAWVAGTGQSPHQFVLEQRLRQACSRLQDGESPLADVAAACGFASQQHLTQVMRRRLNVTPARYRRDQALS